MISLPPVVTAKARAAPIVMERAPSRSSRTDDVEWGELPPDAQPEKFIIKRGVSMAVYKIAYVREGPVQRAASDGMRFIEYMYAHFVFRWVEGESKVVISHGTLDGERMSLPWTFNIDGRWEPGVLAQRGREWVLAHLAKF